jgi:hypothetical protein
MRQLARSPMIVLAFLFGCSSSSTEATPQVDSGKTKDTAVDLGAVDTTPATCTVCDTTLSGDPPPTGWECIKTLDAEILDAVSGAPVPNITIMACSGGLCINDVTKADGKVHLVPCHYMKEPAFKVFGFTELVPFSVPMRNPKDTFVYTKIPVTHLPSTGTPIKVGEAQTFTMAGLTLQTGTGPKNMVVDVFAPYPDFRAVQIPDGKWAPELDGGHGLEVLFGVGPQNTTMDPPGKVTIPNVKAWPAGTVVEFWLHNFELLTGVPVKMGEWWKVATGTVSGDGKTISTDAGQGLPMLSLFGVRKAP